MKWVPNALSVSRLPIGAAIAFAATDRRWSLAFGLLLLGLATDWLDGWFAVKLDAKTQLGGDVLEPVCDLALVSGALAGLLFTSQLSWGTVMALAAVAAVFQIIIFTVPEPQMLRKVANGVMPFYYLGVVVVMIAAYAMMAKMETVLLLAPPLAMMAIRVKRHRLNAWLHGRAV